MKRTNKSAKAIDKLSTKNKQVKKTSAKRIAAKVIQSKSRKFTKEKELFPVVAIGASAGGIEAISNLLENLPANLKMAYIIIQHLAPNHESILPELLERKTKMPVHQAHDSMHIAPDKIYVIPPNTYMSIEDSTLKLSPRIKTDGSFHSIDFFLNSLASVYKHRAIAIILSGTATDGTVGVQAIKAEGGFTFAQDDSAKFQGMPKSAIDSGFIDLILSPADIAKQLKAFPEIIYSLAASHEEILSTIDEHELKKIYSLLHNKHRVDFSYYKPSTINRRIIRRMALNRIAKKADYIKLLQQKATEVELLYKDLLINVTSFFRDEALYTALSKKIFPALLKDRRPNEPIRIWIPACSSGEEAYSTAICLFEYLKGKALTAPIQVFATDLSESSIERARAGIYPKGAMQHISPARLKKFFVKIDGSYQITKAIRDICIFATHDLLKDPPFSRMDMISCQNVLIYLEASPQKKILQGFHYALRPSGYLVLGKSETIGNSSELFTQVARDHKIYVKKHRDALPGFDFSLRSYYPASNNRENKKIVEQQITDVNIDKETEKVLLSRYIPASVVVDKDLQIQRFLGATSQFLQPVSGKASLHLLKMVRDELALDLRTLLHRAKKENRPVKKEGIIISENGNSKELNIEIVPVKSSSRDVYYLIVFKDARLLPSYGQQTDNGKKNKKDPRDKRIAVLERQLTEAGEQMKTMSEEFEATREELQSSNEEVLSSNEELQSINEEIETSKEELQSANEELNTINEELERRNNELREAVEYSEAIVQTIDEPLVLLNPDMRIKMANRAFHRNFKTVDDEVEGLNFFEINKYQWDIPELRKKLSELFSEDKNFEEFELEHVFPHLGERILRLGAIRIHKADPQKNAILLVLEDITQRKKVERQLKESVERFRLLVQNASDVITILSEDGLIIYESESVENILGYTPKQRIWKNIFKEPIVHPDDVVIKENALKKAKSLPNEKVRAEFRLKHSNGGYKDIEAVYVNLIDDPRIGGIVANYHDVTEQKKLEHQREEFISIASHELKTPVTSMKGYIQIIQEMFSTSDDKMSMDLINKLDLQVDRLNNLIKDLLDITRIRQGALEFRESKFEIDKIINEVIVEMQFGSRRHVIIAELKAGKTITGDKERIGQVLTNLISNAIKYSPKADKIIVSSNSNEEIVTVCVQDFGIGIEPDAQKRIFTRFFRVYDKSQIYPGLGLGLYIAHEVVKRHGGTFRVESAPGKGSSFCFTLPIKYSPVL